MSQSGSIGSSGGIIIPVTVPNGGTGQTSGTAHTVVLWEGTAPLGSAGPGTAGQVLTSNGAGADPSFQTIGGGLGNISLVEDFYANIDPNGEAIFTLPFLSVSTGNTGIWSPQTTFSNNHPGIIGNEDLTTTANLFLGAGVVNNPGSPPQKNFILGGGAIQIDWVFNIATLSNGTNRYIIRVGMGDTDTQNTDQANGVYAEYSDNINAGNWQYKTANAGTRTTTTTAIPVATGWNKITVNINAAGTSVTFSLNGVSLGAAITTNIPVTGITPMFYFSQTDGTIAANSIYVDYFGLTQSLTVSR